MHLSPGPRNLITDVPGLKVGNVQDAALKSGATVLVGDAPMVASAFVMGGAPGTRDTDLLAPDKTVTAVDALVLSGGSAFGLDACSGVMDGLQAQGRGFAVGPVRVPIVPGAIVFDLLNGGDKNWLMNPYYDLGFEAYDAAGSDFEIGTVGGGTGALTGAEKGGLGSASFVVGEHTVGALVIANPVGTCTTPGGKHFWAAPFEVNGEFGGLGPDPEVLGGVVPNSAKLAQARHGENTTIAVVATDAPLTKAQCHRLAVAAHDGMARAIVPSHTPFDGDLVFGASTGDGSGVGEMDLVLLGHAAATCLARAIARGVYAARAQAGDVLPTWQDGV